MNEDIDNLFDDEDLELEEVQVEEVLEDFPADDIFGFETVTEKTEETPSLVNDLLITHGIKDGKIKIIDEENKESIIDFFSLPKEDQLEILSTPKEKEILSEEEQKFIDNLRAGNISIQEYLQKFKEDSLKEVAPIETSYDIDSYDDQELFLLDLKAKYDLTDEELTAELQKELENEDLFKKKVNKLREDYKQLEDNYKKEQQDTFTREREDKYNKFVDQMVDVAVKSSDLYGIELEDSEKNEVLSFLLDLDENGVSNFYRELQTPEKLYEAAWFLRYGKEAMDALKDAYENEISKLKKDKTQVVVHQKDTNRIRSIHEI